MTRDEIVQQAVDGAVDRRGRLLLAGLAAVVAVGAATLFWLWADGRGEVGELRTTVAELETEADAAGRDAAALADQVRALGAAPIVDPGPPAEPARPGRGVTGTSLTGDGRLLIAYSDGTTQDLGRIVQPGAPGRGVTATSLVDGHLVLVYSDGTTQDVGPVVGDAGANGRDGADGEPVRRVASTAVVNGRLVVTYTDGATADAGPLPAGTPPLRWTTTRADGSEETCTRADPFDPAARPTGARP